MSLYARLKVVDENIIEVLSPSVGYVRDLVNEGAWVGPQNIIGQLTALGSLSPILLPKDAPAGRVQQRSIEKLGLAQVGQGEVLFRYEKLSNQIDKANESVEKSSSEGALIFRSPMSGRFYQRPSPDRPALVEIGAVIETGHALCLVEVMKTFHRIVYGGDGFPSHARIKRALRQDGEDMSMGDPLFELEAIEIKDVTP